jgi:hypothetical protein
MKKLAALNLFTAWLVLAIALILFSAPAQAYVSPPTLVDVYDDFNGSTINSSLWVSGGMSGLFSQAGNGDLHFLDTIGGLGYYQNLRSTSRQDMPFFVSMEFSDFQATNSYPAPFAGSGPILWIGYTANSLRIYEYIDTAGTPSRGFYAIQRFQNGDVVSKVHLGDAVATGADRGRLGIGYDGSIASLWYAEGLGGGWQLFTTVAPDFTNDPYFAIQGYNEYGTYLSFQVEQVQFTPVPLPAGVVLLGSGLLRLVLAGRKFRKD